jgi:hypothetical protein
MLPVSTGVSAAEALSGVLVNHVERSLARYIMTSLDDLVASQGSPKLSSDSRPPWR